MREEIINILEHGTGVVYLGFPECPWCTAYVPYLNEVAKANDVDKVYYYNILNDRKDNTDNYKKMIDILIIEPCTGNTLAKLANGINDTPVTLAAKSHIRNGGAVLLAVSTNDALGAAAANIGRLLNTKHIYFVPMRQDDHIKKPNSIVADFSKTYDAAVTALSGVQLEPLLLAPSAV